MITLHDRTFGELQSSELIALLRLRSEVFVVEQDCVYLDIDGRDDESATRHIWLQQAPEDGGVIVACLRLLQDPNAQRIGRVVTAAEHRGNGYAARLLEHSLATSVGPWVLSAQTQLEDWYGQFGFHTNGPGYLEDGLPHLPMRREPANAH